MKKHVNVALFVPHCGCPHACLFCDQRAISGQSAPLTPEQVTASARRALETGGAGGELAFFGGSFTAVDRSYMLSLLRAAAPFVRSGAFSGIRCSTRPDAIDEERLDILKSYGVTAVELGAQSMDDRVLRLNGRGHTAADTARACGLIRAYGIGLGLQMMTGLYGDTDEGALKTAESLAALQPDTVRVYPTVVLENTPLARLYREGRYRPQTLEEAVRLCARLLLFFDRRGIPVIRMGLHAGGDVEAHRLAGAYHPAFRELCEGEIYYALLRERLSALPRGTYCITVAPSEISKLVGQKKINFTRLAADGYFCRAAGDAGLDRYRLTVEEVRSADRRKGKGGLEANVSESIGNAGV